MPRDLEVRLAEHARRTGRSKSVVLRMALAGYLDRPAKGRAVSVADGARDLIGCLDGPPDLSTNRDYLDDQGA